MQERRPSPETHLIRNSGLLRLSPRVQSEGKDQPETKDRSAGVSRLPRQGLLRKTYFRGSVNAEFIESKLFALVAFARRSTRCEAQWQRSLRSSG